MIVRILGGVFFLVILIGCQQNPKDISKKHFKALGNTDFIESIVTRAACKGPDGKYQTRTQSSFSSDYLLFQQDYDYKSNPFYAVVYSMDSGDGLDSALNVKGSLSKPVIGVLKAHEFHELAMQFDSRYDEMIRLSDTLFFDVLCQRISAKDLLGLPVNLYFNTKTHLMEGFTQVNPYKKSELIQIHFQEWYEQQGVQLFDKLTILQGSEAKFTFDYQEVLFNAPEFQILSTIEPQ